MIYTAQQIRRRIRSYLRAAILSERLLAEKSSNKKKTKEDKSSDLSILYEEKTDDF